METTKLFDLTEEIERYIDLPLLTGSKLLEVPKDTRLDIETELAMTLWLVKPDENGELIPVKKLGPRREGQTTLSLNFSEDCFVQMNVPDNTHTAVRQTSLVERVDNVPVEIPTDMDRPMSLRDQIHNMIAEAVRHEFGGDAAESIEESLDFDIPDEIDPMSGYEMMDMEEDFLDEPITEEPVPADPVPTPDEPAPTTDTSGTVSTEPQP